MKYLNVNSLERVDEVDSMLMALWQRRMELQPIVDCSPMAPSEGGVNQIEHWESLCEQTGEELEPYARAFSQSLSGLIHSYQCRTLAREGAISTTLRHAVETTPKLFPEKAIVACQGVEGAYSGIAATKIFNYPKISYFQNWQEVVHSVEMGLCRYGVLPIENSTAGSVNAVYDLMAKHHFYIVRSLRLKINHTLLANPGAKLESITEIYSHEQAIQQCSKFLSQHPEIKVHICENTAMAAKRVMESGRKEVAAISSMDCKELYHLSILSDEVQNKDNNYTRFICISKNLEIYPGADKTSIVLKLPHKPGALYHVLTTFYAKGINILKLESRPIQNRDFEFLFYFDINASVYSEAFYEVIEELNQDCEGFQYLGSYSEVI